MGWLNVGLGFIAEFLRGLLADLRRERELKQSGFDDAVQQAHQEADARKDTVDEALADWNTHSGDDLERMRVEHGHYRPATDRPSDGAGQD